MTHLLLAARTISTLVTTYLEGSPHTSASSSGPSASKLLLHVGVQLRLLPWQAFPGEKGKPMPALAPIPTAALNLQTHPKALGENICLRMPLGTAPRMRLFAIHLQIYSGFSHVFSEQYPPQAQTPGTSHWQEATLFKGR